jgi:hypothetical protein
VSHAAWVSRPAAARGQQHDDVHRLAVSLLAPRHSRVDQRCEGPPLLQQGNYAGAQAAANESRKWSRLAIIIGLVWYAIVLVCCVIAVAAGVFSSGTSTTTY